MYKIRKFASIPVLIVVLGMVAFSPVQVQSAQATGATVVYDIYATDGYMKLADGTPVYIYGFVGGREGQPLDYLDKNGAVQHLASVPPPTGGPVTPAEQVLAGNAQFPAPVIYASAGDVVEIRLKNLGVTNPIAPNDPHSIHLHALDVEAANDGVPETSVGTVPANLCADGTYAPCAAGVPLQPGAGNVVVYMFSTKKAGTYFYHCHQEADIHVQMGMFGALIIYNPTDAAASTGPGKGKGGNLFGWKYDKDYVMLLSELDVRQHCSEEGTYNPLTGLCPPPADATLPGQASWNPVDFDPQYWFINGLSFPNTIHVDTPGAVAYADWIQAHPNYDAFIQGSVSGGYTHKGERVLVRMINMGFETHPMHVHGFHFKVIGGDQRAWTWANIPGLTPFGIGLEKNTIMPGSGEEYDLLIDMGQQKVTSTYPPSTYGLPPSLFSGGTQTRYDQTDNSPKSNTLTTLPAIMQPDNGLPYDAGPVVTGLHDLPMTGQLFPWHDHDDYKATNNGVYPGGMFTMIETLP